MEQNYSPNVGPKSIYGIGIFFKLFEFLVLIVRSIMANYACSWAESAIAVIISKSFSQPTWKPRAGV